MFDPGRQFIAKVVGRQYDGLAAVVYIKPELIFIPKKGVGSQCVDHFSPPGRRTEGAVNKDNWNSSRAVWFKLIDTVEGDGTFEKFHYPHIPDKTLVQIIGQLG